MPNFKYDSTDIIINLKDFSNISQQEKKISKIENDTFIQLDYDNFPVKLKRYEKKWEIKVIKTRKRRWNIKIKQIKKDNIFKVKVYYLT